MENIIEIKNLKKYYGEIKAVDDISFNVESGTLFAFLGINGAGKSTTINVLSTLNQKDEGYVLINGHNIDKESEAIKKDIGIVFQTSVLDTKLSVKDNLSIRASYYGLNGKEWNNRLEELTKMFELESILKRPFGKLSGGQKRKVDIARGLINQPKLLFLDEPTTGLDPKTRIMIWNVINKIIVENNMTVFLTTHYMEEAEKAHKVVIIDNGKIIANDTPTNLKNTYSGNYIQINQEKSDVIDNAITNEGLSYRYENDAYFIKVIDSEEALGFLYQNKNLIKDFEVIKGNMDDVFLNATGKKLEA